MTSEQRNSREVRRAIRIERIGWSRDMDIHVMQIVNNDTIVCAWAKSGHRAEAMRRRSRGMR